MHAHRVFQVLHKVVPLEAAHWIRAYEDCGLVWMSTMSQGLLRQAKHYSSLPHSFRWETICLQVLREKICCARKQERSWKKTSEIKVSIFCYLIIILLLDLINVFIVLSRTTGRVKDKHTWIKCTRACSKVKRARMKNPWESVERFWKLEEIMDNSSWREELGKIRILSKT